MIKVDQEVLNHRDKGHIGTCSVVSPYFRGQFTHKMTTVEPLNNGHIKDDYNSICWISISIPLRHWDVLLRSWLAESGPCSTPVPSCHVTRWWSKNQEDCIHNDQKKQQKFLTKNVLNWPWKFCHSRIHWHGMACKLYFYTWIRHPRQGNCALCSRREMRKSGDSTTSLEKRRKRVYWVLLARLESV